MQISDYFNEALYLRLTVAMVHFLWQGFLVAFLAILASRVFGKNSSRVRHGIYLGSLLIMVSCVTVTFGAIERLGGSSTVTGTASAISDESPAGNAALPATSSAAGSLSTTGSGFDLTRYAPLIAQIYSLGVFLMLIRVLLSYRGGRRFLNCSTPVDDPSILVALAKQAKSLGMTFTPALAYCEKAVVPTVVGVLRPTILLPFSFATGLSGEQMEMILAHEMAHILRCDPLLNVVQKVIEAVLFFHPAVWFISNRIRIEREHCCDDMVLRGNDNAVSYASSLLELASRGLALSPVADGLNATGQPSHFRDRVLRLLGAGGKEQLRLKRVWVIGACTALVLGCFIASCSQQGNESPATSQKTASHVKSAIEILCTTPETDTERVQMALDEIRNENQTEVLAQLGKWLESKEATKRRSAVYMIQMLPWDDPSPVFPALRKLLEHKEGLTRGMAAMALASIGDAESYDSLISMLRGDRDSYARRCVAWAVGELGNSDGLAALNTALSDRDVLVKQNVKNSIARLEFLKEHENIPDGQENAIKGLWLIAGSTPTQKERLDQAVELIGSVAEPDRKRILEEAAAGDDPFVRNSALFYCAMTGEEITVPEDAIAAFEGIKALVGSPQDSERITAEELHRKKMERVKKELRQHAESLEKKAR